jgi:hypothetical protein
MSSRVKSKSLAELEKIHTGALLRRRKVLLACEESFERSDQVEPSNSGMIEFKNTPEWQQAYQELKSALDTRENFPNKQERKSKEIAVSLQKHITRQISFQPMVARRGNPLTPFRIFTICVSV